MTLVSHPSAEFLVENTPAGVLYVSRSGSILYANPAACGLFGYPPSVFSTLTLAHLLPDSIRAHHDQLEARFWANPQSRPMGSQPLEISARCEDGSLFPAEIALLPASEDMVVCVVRDITTYKALQRTQLLLARRSRLDALGRMAAGVAHEINNPAAFIRSNLGILTGYLQGFRKYVSVVRSLKSEAESSVPLPPSLVERYDDAERDLLSDNLEDAEQIVSECQHGTESVIQIVSALNAFASTDSSEPNPTANLPLVLDHAVRLVRSQVEFAADLEYERPPDVVVRGDAIRLQQVVLNLLINAVQAMKEHGTIWLNARTQGSEAIISVRDTGIGMCPKTLEKIFDPFFTTKAVGSGTGLGLSVSHEIVEGAGGRIVVQSEVGSGSVFEVFLRVAGQEDL